VKRIIYLGIALFFILFLVFCSDGGLAPYEKDFVFPAKNISFYSHIQPMIDAKCGIGSGCHNAGTPTNLLFYNTLENFINHRVGKTEPRLLLVDPDIDRYNPQNSTLYQLLTVDFDKQYLGYERMPPLSFGRDKLSEEELRGVRQWIQEGAPE
jgi:hypothetical protein